MRTMMRTTMRTKTRTTMRTKTRATMRTKTRATMHTKTRTTMWTTTRTQTLCVLGLALVVACKGKRGAPEESRAVMHSTATGAGPGAPPADMLKAEVEKPERAKLRADADRPEPKAVLRRAAAAPAATTPPEPSPDSNAKTQEGPTRAWFPETFLFEPLVVPDDRGAAVVPVRVPDRLTTWRVLALAHSRTGAQGGAVTSFLGTLPIYVDPVVPGFLVPGEVVRMPVQIINTTATDGATAHINSS